MTLKSQVAEVIRDTPGTPEEVADAILKFMAEEYDRQVAEALAPSFVEVAVSNST